MFTSTSLRTLVAGGALSVALLGVGPALASAATQAGDGTCDHSCDQDGSAEQVRAGVGYGAQNDGVGWGQADDDVVGSEYGGRFGGNGAQPGDLDRDRLMDGDQTGVADRQHDRLGDGSCLLDE